MPVSDDELDHGYPSHPHPPPPHGLHTMSKAEQRRSNKPIMEKRRRARINHCLNELKSLILDAMNKDPARHSKLEKADILEMTVRHLQSMQRQQLTAAVGADPAVVTKFSTGFSECAGEVSRYIARLEGVEAGVRQRLVAHLAGCVSNLPGVSARQQPEDVNNNQQQQQRTMNLRLIPSRLPSGELALLLPDSKHLPFFPMENQVSTTSGSESRQSAFTAVNNGKFVASSRTPPASPTSTTTSSLGDDSCDPYPSPAEVSSTSEPPRPEGPLQMPSSRHLPSTFPRFPSASQIQTPLTVITSDEMLKRHPQSFVDYNSPPIGFKNPLDFSFKKDATSGTAFKRPRPEDHSEKLLMTSSEHQPRLKMPKLFSDSQTPNLVLERRSLFEIQNHTQTSSTESLHGQVDRRSVVEVPNKPSTSTQEEARDMWRPW